MTTLLRIQSQDLSNYLCLDTGIVVMQVGLWSFRFHVEKSEHQNSHSPITNMIILKFTCEGLSKDVCPHKLF